MGMDVKFVPVEDMPHSATEAELVAVSRFINQIIPNWFVITLYSNLI